jgi:hypothetical protein
MPPQTRTSIRDSERTFASSRSPWSSKVGVACGLATLPCTAITSTDWAKIQRGATRSPTRAIPYRIATLPYPSQQMSYRRQILPLTLAALRASRAWNQQPSEIDGG